MTTVRYTTIKGEVIAEKRNGSRRLYVPDPLGSTVALLDNTQTQVDTFAYWPYGEVRTSTGTTPPPFQFVGTAGYYTDGVSRSYVRARYLHTQKTKWSTEDPIGFLGGDSNLTRYVSNRPTILRDPSGLSILFQCFYVPPPPKYWPAFWDPNGNPHDCSWVGPGSGGNSPGTPAARRAKQDACYSCCDWYFPLPKQNSDCKDCCVQYNSGSPEFPETRHCQSRKRPFGPPTPPPRTSPPGQSGYGMWD
jgi:RHS repeat-associated protein